MRVMVWKKCEITGAPEESCAHCNPDRYLPPIKTRGRWQVHNERKSLDTADGRAGGGDKSDQESEERMDSEPESRIRERLKSLRIELARERKVSPFLIFTNLALDEMVILKPASLSDLANCEHLMNTQISDYGKQIIEVVVAVVGE
jgi:superfamily II DNA helicase RecQ